MNKLKGLRFRKSTRKNYYKIWKLFNNFFIRLDQKPKSWEHRLVLYVTYLILIGRESATISSCISAITAVLLTEGIEISRESFTLTVLVKTCKTINDRLHIRLGITKGLLHMIINRVDREFTAKSQDYLAIGWHGLLHVGEITKGDHPIIMHNMYIGDNKSKL